MPRKNPKAGIKAWNPPKYNATTIQCLGVTLRTLKPLHKLTAKASAAKAQESKKILQVSTLNPS